MGFSTKYGCRICRTLTTKVNYHTCFLEKESIERDVSDFRSPDPFNVSKKKKLVLKWLYNHLYLIILIF